MCGRGFGNETAQTLAGVGPLPALRCGRLCSACVQGLNAMSVKAQSPASTALHRALRCATVCSKVVLRFKARTWCRDKIAPAPASVALALLLRCARVWFSACVVLIQGQNLGSVAKRRIRLRAQRCCLCMQRASPCSACFLDGGGTLFACQALFFNIGS